MFLANGLFVRFPYILHYYGTTNYIQEINSCIWNKFHSWRTQICNSYVSSLKSSSLNLAFQTETIVKTQYSDTHLNHMVFKEI